MPKKFDGLQSAISAKSKSAEFILSMIYTFYSWLLIADTLKGVNPNLDYSLFSHIRGKTPLTSNAYKDHVV
jgi:hypothetical protein